MVSRAVPCSTPSFQALASYVRETCTYNLEEIIWCVVVHFEIQLLDNGQLHLVNVIGSEGTVVVIDHVRYHSLH